MPLWQAQAVRCESAMHSMRRESRDCSIGIWAKRSHRWKWP